MTEKIKLFVGTSPNGEDAEQQAVLEYTARKNSSMDIDIVWMKMTHDPLSHWYGWETSTWSTPFSGFRWGIPSYCNFEGQAIYMDCDMMVLGDLAELWNEPFQPGKIIQMKGDWRTCVAKWNCELVKDWILPIERIRKIPHSHQRLFGILQGNSHIVQVFDRQWNNFDGENDRLEDIKILHYTDMSTQPSFLHTKLRLEKVGQKHWFDGEYRKHRREDVEQLFDKLLDEANEYGFKVENYIPTELFGDIVKNSQANYRANNGFDVTKGE